MIGGQTVRRTQKGDRALSYKEPRWKFILHQYSCSSDNAERTVVYMEQGCCSIQQSLAYQLYCKPDPEYKENLKIDTINWGSRHPCHQCVGSDRTVWHSLRIGQALFI